MDQQSKLSQVHNNSSHDCHTASKELEQWKQTKKCQLQPHGLGR